jgi:hypothetical protein
MAAVGYEFLRETLELGAFEFERPALLKPVTRIEPADTFLAVPKHVAPDSADPLEHTLFALKHEGTRTTSTGTILIDADTPSQNTNRSASVDQRAVVRSA